MAPASPSCSTCDIIAPLCWACPKSSSLKYYQSLNRKLSINKMNTKEFKIKTGEVVTISIDDDGENIIVHNQSGIKIGKIELAKHEQDDDYTSYEWYKITWMFLDAAGNKYTHQGIGRECLKWHKEIYMLPITAAEDNGQTYDDGSHLTGDAPGFIRKMREEGIVVKTSDSNYDEDDY